MLTALRHRSAGLLAGFAILLAACTGVPSAQAGDFQAKRVAADADWIAFVNVEGLVKSTLVKFVLEHGKEMDIDINTDDLAAFGIDPMKDIRDITAFGKGNPEEMHFALIATTSSAIDQALAQLKEQAGGDDDKAMVEIDGQKVNVLSDGDMTAFVQVRPGPTSADRVLITAMSREWMSIGMKAVDGKVATLDKAGDKVITARPSDGALFFATISDLAWVKQNHEGDETFSAITKGAKGATVEMGESGDDTFVNARLNTGSAEDAQDLSDMLRGLIGLARMAVKQEPDFKPAVDLLRSLELKTDGAAIAVSCKHSSQGLIDALKAVAAADNEDAAAEAKSDEKSDAKKSKDKDE